MVELARLERIEVTRRVAIVVLARGSDAGGHAEGVH